MSISASKIAVWNRALDRIGETDGIESEDELRPAADVCRRHYDDLLRELLEAHPWRWAIRELPLSNIDDQSQTTPGDAFVREFDVPYVLLDPSKLEVVLVDASGGETVLTPVDDYTLALAEEGSNASVTLAVAPIVGESVRVTVSTSRTGWRHAYTLPADCVTPLALLYQDTRFSLLPVKSRAEWTIVANDAGDGALFCANLDSDQFDALEYVALIDYVPAMPRKFVDALSWRLAEELAYAIKKDAKLAQYCSQMCMRATDEAWAQSDNVTEEVTEPTTPSIMARG